MVYNKRWQFVSARMAKASVVDSVCDFCIFRPARSDPIRYRYILTGGDQTWDVSFTCLRQIDTLLLQVFVSSLCYVEFNRLIRPRRQKQQLFTVIDNICKFPVWYTRSSSWITVPVCLSRCKTVFFFYVSY